MGQGDAGHTLGQLQAVLAGILCWRNLQKDVMAAFNLSQPSTDSSVDKAPNTLCETMDTAAGLGAG